jgi:3-oxoacyl-[acyl-carrier protein] reductase
MKPPDCTVVVTGSGSGIGRACAVRLADPGTRVIAMDRDGAAAQRTVRVLNRRGALAAPAICDVTEPKAVAAALAGVERVDVLVNSAGVFGERAVEEITNYDMRAMYEVNAIGLFTVIRELIGRVPAGGRIVNIGSRAYLGSRRHAHYAASKAAVIGLTRTLALEFLHRQISVNAVAPGMVLTPLLAGISEKRLAQIAAGYPGGRLPTPEDVAQAVAFFADPSTRFITGQVLLLDGGRSLGVSPA